MKPYYERDGIRIFHGDCRDVLPALGTGSVDAIVTDPPYGLSFMGKAWDHGVPGVPFWAEALRVLKPGGHLLAFGGTRTHHRLMVAIEDVGFEVRDCLMWLYGSGFPKGKGQLKPAWEPIILARKPLAGTVVENVLAHGTGALNIDGCRIPGVMDGKWGGRQDSSIGYGGTEPAQFRTQAHAAGRWPANVCLDDEAAALLDAQSGISKTHKPGPASTPNGKKYGRFGAQPAFDYGDTGGASRFFYTAKASRSERGAYNDHPTVKPLALMRWLVRLVTPPGGVVLDPFLGSGSTLLASAREGFAGIGIEVSEEYCEIAAKRLEQMVLPLEAVS